MARYPEELGSSHLGTNYLQKQVTFLSLSMQTEGQLGPSTSYLGRMRDGQSREASKRTAEARKVQGGRGRSLKQPKEAKDAGYGRETEEAHGGWEARGGQDKLSC